MMILALPTWILTLLARHWMRAAHPHPWFGRRFTLAEWHQSQSQFLQWCDFMLWCFSFALSLVIGCR